MFHVNNDGDVKVCRARVKPCRFELHGETAESTQRVYEDSMRESSNISSVKKASEILEDSEASVNSENLNKVIEVADKPLEAEFSKESYFGKRSPRDVQLGALNGVVEALAEDDSTQLIAACGTGKTFMHRQLLRQMMDGEDSNGIGVILTSSIKLAKDTASDLRPEGGYDESLGKFDKDYVVVEVHSGVGMIDGRQSVKENGVINVDRIYNQIGEALKEGKKVVIVSTYDSVNKVQEAQAKFADSESVRADLLIHDEAHNILGQQKPTTVASDGNELTAYVGFHDSIPGSLQSRKRLYSTATPIVRETEGDKQPTGNIDSIIESSLKMKAGDQYERITVYSDDELVGKVGGFISQSEAIDNKCLSKPSYEIRESALKGDITKFKDPVVNIRGEIKERSENSSESDLNPNTYGALVSTLNAMAADAEGDKNSANNVLAYVGSINQAESFKKALPQVALHESRGMSLEDARDNMNSPDSGLKRRARMRLLAEEVEVLAAHSRTDSDSSAERAQAFKMFKGNAVQSNEWTPRKKVLSNVNIFSEGVSISEIDTVVISDDDKLNEKSMTQAIGRAIRVVPGNDVKKYGHVIIPAVVDSSGTTLNSSSVNLAAYTATRVERGSTASKLRGEKLEPDFKTSFKIYGSDGNVKETLAQELAQNSITSVEDLAVALEISSNRTYLSSNSNENYEVYRSLSKDEQFALAKQRVHDKVARLKKQDTDSAIHILKVRDHMQNKSAAEIQEISKNGKVVSAALAISDLSSLNPKLTKELINKNILRTNSEVADVSVEEKRRLINKYSRELASAIISTPPNASAAHVEARNMLPQEILNDRLTTIESIKSVKNDSFTSPKVENLQTIFSKNLENDQFVSKVYTAISTADQKAMPIFGWMKSKDAFAADRKNLDQQRIDRQHESAFSGEQTYTVDPKSVRKTGELNASALRTLLSDNALV